MFLRVFEPIHTSFSFVAIEIVVRYFTEGVSTLMWQQRVTHVSHLPIGLIQKPDCKFFTTPLFGNSQRLQHNKNQTKQRYVTRDPT